MKCLVFVKFLPGGSLTPDQFFSHLNAGWGWYDGADDVVTVDENQYNSGKQHPKVLSAVCVADYDSIQQLAIDISIMPGAGIAGIEVMPVPEEAEAKELLNLVTGDINSMDILN
jgi:hypothetical protein